MDALLFPSIENFKEDKVQLANLEYVVIQEKLDGCNFRIIFNRPGSAQSDAIDSKPEIQFGSRTVVFDEKTSFHGYQRIRPELESKVRALAESEELRDKSFVVFGELVGYNAGGKPILDRFKYFDDTKIIKYFAYEIYTEKDPNSDTDPAPETEEYTEEDEAAKIADHMDFFRAQELLQKANFDMIPYTIMQAAEYSYEKLLDFKSILLDHNDFARMEGYILRFKYTDGSKFWTLKLKPENLVEFQSKPKLRPFDTVKEKKAPKADDKFVDYISKVPYLDDDHKLIDPSYAEICLREFQKEAGITTKKEFSEFFKSLSLYCREKPNYNELLKKFNQLVADAKR